MQTNGLLFYARPQQQHMCAIHCTVSCTVKNGTIALAVGRSVFTQDIETPESYQQLSRLNRTKTGTSRHRRFAERSHYDQSMKRRIKQWWNGEKVKDAGLYAPYVVIEPPLIRTLYESTPSWVRTAVLGACFKQATDAFVTAAKALFL